MECFKAEFLQFCSTEFALQVVGQVPAIKFKHFRDFLKIFMLRSSISVVHHLVRQAVHSSHQIIIQFPVSCGEKLLLKREKSYKSFAQDCVCTFSISSRNLLESMSLKKNKPQLKKIKYCITPFKRISLLRFV